MKTINSNYIMDSLDNIIDNPRCELLYNKDYELLIATILSAQSTDKRVNIVTKKLFSKYDLDGLSKADLNDIESIIKSVGTYKRKAMYIKEVAKRLLNDYNGVVPNNREYLESLPGVGRKTANVVLSNIYNVPAFAVDTHVYRVSKRLGICSDSDDVFATEKKLMNCFPKDKWNRLHHQLVLFGRYYCTSKKPQCTGCPFLNFCTKK